MASRVHIRAFLLAGLLSLPVVILAMFVVKTLLLIVPNKALGYLALFFLLVAIDWVLEKDISWISRSTLV